MSDFCSTDVPDYITINSFVTLFHSKLTSDYVSLGESNGEAHSFWEFLYIESGSISVLVDGKLNILTAGNMIIYAPYSFHCVAALEDASINIVGFSTHSSLLLGLSNQVISLGKDLCSELSDIMSIGVDMFEKPVKTKKRGMELRKSADNLKVQKLAKHIELFLIDLYETTRNDKTVIRPTGVNTENYYDEQFEKLSQYLKEHISSPLSLEEISEAISISESNLQRLCRKHCGCGPVTYFISLKIGAAKDLINESSLNFTEIAERLGFSSVHYFSKLFKLKTGMTPSEYAKSIYRV